MPTRQRASDRAVAAGWYPDPLGPPGQLRWWDGSVWTSSVRTPDAPRSRIAAPPSRPPRRKRRMIAWASVGAFALAVSGMIIAVLRDQDVCEVSATGVKFCERDGEAREEMAAEQPAIEEQAREREEQAQAAATDETAPGLADLSGTWFSDNGFTYTIEQFGDQAVMTELDPLGMTTAVASGTVDGSRFAFDFQAWDGSFGTGELELDGDTLSGRFDNAVSGVSTSAELHR